MAARSLALDLMQLTSGEFRSTYKWNNLSDTEFLELKALAASAPNSKILIADAGAVDIVALSGANDAVVTSIYAKTFGAAGSFDLRIATSAGNLDISMSPVTSNYLPAEVSLSNLAMPVSSVSIQNVTGGTPNVYIVVCGYVPAAV